MLPSILETAGRELAELGVVTARLRETLAPSTAAQVQLETLDNVTQHLFALADLLSALAPRGNGSPSPAPSPPTSSPPAPNAPAPDTSAPLVVTPAMRDAGRTAALRQRPHDRPILGPQHAIPAAATCKAPGDG